MTQEQSTFEHFASLIANLQKRVYALEHEIQRMQRVKDKRK